MSDKNLNADKSPQLYTLNFIFVSVLVILFSLLFGYIMLLYTDNYTSDNYPSCSADIENQYPLIVIDPGHGGEDGGASGITGIIEKNLNLSISRKLYLIFDLLGIPAKMTRDDDRLLYDIYGDLEDYTGHKKSYDLKNRLKIASENPNSIFISIHMNKFNQEKYSGLQVYYSGNNDQSRNLAGLIQSNTKLFLQPGNSREIKKSGSSIFLLNRLQIPAVLVECGFLSNKNDCLLLSDKLYQQKLSAVLFASASEFLNVYTNLG